MAQMLVVFKEIGEILNPLHGITPRMMSTEDEKLGFVEGDFPGACRKDMFVVSHPDHFASRAIGDFSSENIQHDLFPDSTGNDDFFLVNEELLFTDEEVMHDPVYAKAWAEFIAEKGDKFYSDRWMDNFMAGDSVNEKFPTSQRQQEKITMSYDSYRIGFSHGRRGRKRAPSIPERVRHHHKALKALIPAE